jgi:WD40 repeat protein
MRLKHFLALSMMILALLIVAPGLAAQTAVVITPDNAATVEEIGLLEGHTGPVFTLAFSPDSTTLVSGGSRDDYSVRLWDVASAAETALLEGHEAQIAAVAFNVDGSQVETASYDGTLRLWDAASGELVETIDQTADGDPLAISNLATFFSVDGTHVAYFSEASFDINIFDLDSQQEFALSEGSEELADLMETVGALRLSDDGFWLAVEEIDGGPIHLIDLETNLEVTTLERADTESLYFTAIALSADGAMVAAVDDTSSVIQLWDVESGEPTLALSGHEPQNDDFTLGVYGLAFNPDGTLLASASYDGTVRIWDVADGTELAVLETSGEGGSGVVVWSPDGTLLASANVDGSIQLWGVAG